MASPWPMANAISLADVGSSQQAARQISAKLDFQRPGSHLPCIQTAFFIGPEPGLLTSTKHSRFLPKLEALEKRNWAAHKYVQAQENSVKYHASSDNRWSGSQKAIHMETRNYQL